MQIRLLGQLDVRINGRSIVPQAAKPRQIVALLALNPGRLVTVGTIVDEIWGDDPPRSARTTMQTYIMQIRRAIRTADETVDPKDVLVTQGEGYYLAAGTHDSDATQYRELTRNAAQAGRAGHHEEAHRLLDEAMQLWRGDALVDVPAGNRLRPEITRLDEERRTAVEARFGAGLALGHHQQMVGELAYEVSQQPMDEGLCSKYVLALYRCGRQDQAHEAMRTLRQALREELGVDPSRGMRELHGAILRSDASLDWSPQLAAAVA